MSNLDKLIQDLRDDAARTGTWWSGLDSSDDGFSPLECRKLICFMYAKAGYYVEVPPLERIYVLLEEQLVAAGREIERLQRAVGGEVAE
jgi:hypothetical protein